MEPLTTSLLDAIAAASSALLGGLAEAAAGDAWAAAKAKLARWARLDQQQPEYAAFGRALNEAIAELRRSSTNSEHTERVLQLLTRDSPEGRDFLRLVSEEFLFNAEPDLGRMLDEYRHNLRFVAFLRHEEPPPWTEVQPVLLALFRDHLPAQMAKHTKLRQIVLDRADLQALAQAQSIAQSSAQSAATLSRIEALLHDLKDLPRIHATLNAAEGASVSNAPITIVLGNHSSYTVPAPPPDLDALFRSYREFLSKTYAMLDFRGIAQVQNVVRLHLEQIYVPLRGILDISVSPKLIVLSACQSAMDSKSTFNLVSHGSVSMDVMTDKPAIVHFAGHGHGSAFDVMMFGERNQFGDVHPHLHTLVRDTPFLVILGDPGAGKSTLVKVIMLALAEGRAATTLGLSGEWLPIFFPVAAFAEARSDPGQRDLAPLDYLRIYFCGRNQPDYTPLFERALLAGRALLLFDGLDEVREDRLAIVRCLEDLIRAWDAPGNRFLATSRIAGYDDAPLDAGLFSKATIAPFDDDQIRMFAKRWSIAFEQAGLPPDGGLDHLLEQRAEERANDLSTAIFDSPHITALARNPLLLTILALIHNQGTRMPDRRVDLYRLCVESLAKTWNRARSLSGREIDVYLGEEKLDDRFVVNLLGPAALWIHTENPGGIVEERDLEQRLAAILRETDGLPPRKADSLAADFLRLVNRETGLLQERGHRRYGFLHLTFEEYLAARGLVESDIVNPDAEIHRYACDPGWREVLRLAVASATQREASRLLLHLLEAPTDAHTLGRPVVLAAECLQDLGRNGATQRAWRAVIEAMLALLHAGQAPRPTRLDVGHLLGRLGDPRLLDAHSGEALGYGDYADVPSYWCPIAAGSFWFGDERVRGKDRKVQTNLHGTLQRDITKLKRVELPCGFKIARYPVTNAEYARFLAANGPDGYDPTQPWWTEEGREYLFPDGKPRYTEPRFWHDPNLNSPSQPVVGVSWYEAAAYCRWLTAEGHQAGWLPQDQAIRLPTSLEWERAARHTDQRPFPWGDTVPTPEHANYQDTGIGAPTPVGCFPLGRAVCGAEDLIGNVLEWLSTPYQQDTMIQPKEDFTPDKFVLLSFTYYGSSLDQLCCGSRFRYSPIFRNSGGWSFRVFWSLRAH
ncbi:SUMF1/EgtB/PvdO family nonheme iron enzyme [Candidatus Oscillochloris fontis]|uniref:SUMF1/EgtB/PvdO family nonheme iron enzyme n=1 Tax=Candidatus Oscillochloris fontis TaxID=2496868 RepID=UPI00101C1D38|nr:SUMF1/EgtB/PvdO family nonheme iron enzyme [Candidatus Oscillochloris fontis]